MFWNKRKKEKEEVLSFDILSKEQIEVLKEIDKKRNTITESEEDKKDKAKKRLKVIIENMHLFF